MLAAQWWLLSPVRRGQGRQESFRKVTQEEKQRFRSTGWLCSWKSLLALTERACGRGSFTACHLTKTGLWASLKFPCLYLEGKGSEGLLSSQTLESRQNPRSSSTKPHSMVCFAVHSSSLGFKRLNSHNYKKCRTKIFFRSRRGQVGKRFVHWQPFICTPLLRADHVITQRELVLS